MRVLLHPWVPSGKPVPIEGKLMLGSCDRTLSEEDVLDHPSATGLLARQERLRLQEAAARALDTSG